LLSGAIISLGAGGAALWKRIVGAAICGGSAGLLSIILSGCIGYEMGLEFGELAVHFVWRAFALIIATSLGALITELQLPEPFVNPASMEKTVSGKTDESNDYQNLERENV